MVNNNNTMAESLKDALADMSQFISVEVGESFTGIYKGFKRVPNSFDMDKETIELTFDIGGTEKTMTSMSLPKFLVEANVSEGDTVRVKKASKKGNTVVWSVDKVKDPVDLGGVASKPTDEDLASAGL